MAATITVRGLNEAVYEVANLSSTFKSRVKEFCNDLGEVAKNEAQSRHNVLYLVRYTACVNYILNLLNLFSFSIQFLRISIL